jgi:predicted RNase H-like nuclease (RuvC/YqgF family)
MSHDNLFLLAEKQVASSKSAKKLKSENVELLQQVETMQAEIQKLSSELEEHRKPATLSREKFRQESQKRSELEHLQSKYRKAMEFIQNSSLQSEYEQYQQSRLKRKSTLE